MANRLQKLLYFLSSESPVLIFIAILWYVQKKEWQVSIILVIQAIVIDILFVISFNYGRRKIPVIPVMATEIANAEGPLIGYVLSYLLPFGTMTLEDYYLPILVVAIFILELVLTFTDFMSPHPLLFIAGYHFYKIGIEGASKEYYLASKKTLRKPGDVTVVQRVFEFLLIREK